MCLSACSNGGGSTRSANDGSNRGESSILHRLRCVLRPATAGGVQGTGAIPVRPAPRPPHIFRGSRSIAQPRGAVPRPAPPGSDRCRERNGPNRTPRTIASLRRDPRVPAAVAATPAGEMPSPALRFSRLATCTLRKSPSPANQRDTACRLTAAALATSDCRYPFFAMAALSTLIYTSVQCCCLVTTIVKYTCQFVSSADIIARTGSATRRWRVALPLTTKAVSYLRRTPASAVGGGRPTDRRPTRGPPAASGRLSRRRSSVASASRSLARVAVCAGYPARLRLSPGPPIGRDRRRRAGRRRRS